MRHTWKLAMSSLTSPVGKRTRSSTTAGYTVVEPPTHASMEARARG
jgi:hypothetical protein